MGTVEVIEPTHSFTGDYTNDTKQVNHLVAQTGIVRDGKPINFSGIGKRDGNGFSVNIPYSFMDENLRKGVDPEQGITMEVTLHEAGIPRFRRSE